MEETDQPSPPPSAPDEKESALARLNKKLWTALAGLSLLYVAATAAVVGDKTDFLGLGTPPAQASISSQASPDGLAYEPIGEEDLTDVRDTSDDEPSDAGCVEQIRADAGIGQAGRVERVGQGSAPFPTTRTEYYLAYAAGGSLRYVCVIVLPDKITITRADPSSVPQRTSRPAPGKTAQKR